MPTATGAPVFRASAGTKLKYGTWSLTPSYTSSFSVRKYGGLPETKVDTWETTQIDAVNADGSPDLEKYKVFGKRDRGELMFTVAASDAAATAVEANMGVLLSWQVVYGLLSGQTTAATRAFSGAITSKKETVGEKDENLLEITITLSGGVAFAAGS